MTHAPLDPSTRLHPLQPLPASTPQSQDQTLGGQRRLEQQSLARFSLDSSLAGLDASLSKIGEGFGLSDRPVPRSLEGFTDPGLPGQLNAAPQFQTLLLDFKFNLPDPGNGGAPAIANPLFLPFAAPRNQTLSGNLNRVPPENVVNPFPLNLAIAPSSASAGSLPPSTLPNGVASGDTTQTSTVLWTRSTVLGPITFEYAVDPNFLNVVGSATTTVTDPLLPVKVGINELNPNTDYYYRVTNAAGASLIGEFSTAAGLGNFAGLRFGASGDWRGELSPYPAIANAATANLDFFIALGDTVYADFESPVLPGVTQVTTLEEYRLKHSEVYGTRFGLNTWSQLRGSTSILATIDDHEVINDFSGGELIGNDPRFLEAFPGDDPTALINDSTLFENGLQSFQEYNPIRDDFYGDVGDSRVNNERELYRHNTYGSDAAVFVLDTRSFRDQPLEEIFDPTDTALVDEFLTQSFDSSRTFLGEAQLADLKRDLLQAENDGITWKFITVPEPIQNLGVVLASDRFEGYAAERTELLKFIDDNSIDNVVFIAADIHGTVVNNLTYQLGPEAEQLAIDAFEITTGSVAFDAPFGPTVIQLGVDAGFLPPALLDLYNSLPVSTDPDSIPNDRDDLIKLLTNQQLTPFGYDPVGLNDNLPGANLVNATLLQGDYLATHVYGWTDFQVDALTQKLTVTTYGIPFYSLAELEADPSFLLNLTPEIVSQFEVLPNLSQTFVGTRAADNLSGGSADDLIDGLRGNDTIAGLSGNDTLTGGGGNDTFIIRRREDRDTILDFGGLGRRDNPSRSRLAQADTLQFEGEDLNARNLILTQQGNDLVISFEGLTDLEVTLQNFQLQDLENLRVANGPDFDNIRFGSATPSEDSLDVFRANQRSRQVLRPQTVTFLNELNNSVEGFDNSDDVINGQGGDDILIGLSGSDTLRGGAGNDTLQGGEGRDSLQGGEGVDILLGENGADQLSGDSGNDTLLGGNGNDTLLGGLGNDTLLGGNGQDLLVLAAGEGTDTLVDFAADQDQIGLLGLRFDQLAIAQGTGSQALDTLIRVTASNELLAIVSNTQASILTSNLFVTV